MEYIALGVAFFLAVWILKAYKAGGKAPEPEVVALSPKAFDQILSKSPGGPFDRPNESVLIPLESEMSFDVTARLVRIEGSVNCHVKASEQIQIGPKARVEGTVESPQVHMAEGAYFKAKLLMR